MSRQPSCFPFLAFNEALPQVLGSGSHSRILHLVSQVITYIANSPYRDRSVRKMFSHPVGYMVMYPTAYEKIYHCISGSSPTPSAEPLFRLPRTRTASCGASNGQVPSISSNGKPNEFHRKMAVALCRVQVLRPDSLHTLLCATAHFPHRCKESPHQSSPVC